jgi:hypothetical protein
MQHVCVKKANLNRIGYENLREWMEDKRNLYVGRSGRIGLKEADGRVIMFAYPGSKWGNPFVVTDRIPVEEALRLYEKYLVESGLVEHLSELEGPGSQGLNLGCFCDESAPCHAKVLARLCKNKNEKIIVDLKSWQYHRKMTTKTAKLVLKKNNKLDCVYHKDSMLVFKSATEKLVTGRIENDELLPLDEKALELCEEYGFPYDESLVETEEADAAEAEEPAVEEKPVAKTESKADSKTKAKAEAKADAKAEAKPKEVAKAPKKSEASETEESPPEEKKAKVATKKVAPTSESSLESILQRHSEELQEFVASRPNHAEKVEQLEQQVAALKKELDETRKKMKGLLAAMQGEL